jgi:hypothetical protein
VNGARANRAHSPLVGWRKAAHFSDRDCLLLLAGCYVAGGLIVALPRVPPRTPTTSTDKVP